MRIVIQIGGVCSTFCQEEGIVLQKYRDRNGRCIAILFKSIGAKGRLNSPEFGYTKFVSPAEHFSMFLVPFAAQAPPAVPSLELEWGSIASSSNAR